MFPRSIRLRLAFLGKQWKLVGIANTEQDKALARLMNLGNKSALAGGEAGCCIRSLLSPASGIHLWGARANSPAHGAVQRGGVGQRH